MFRNQYDTDVTTWSPQGRLHQVEYAMEAVKQGSACVGLKGRDHVVLATLKRSPEELAGHQGKIHKIDDHMGIAIAGLTADGRILTRWLRNECLNHRFVYSSPVPTARIVRQLADKSQIKTQRSWARPYGVGLLVAGYDSTGPRLFQTCPSADYFEYKAIAIGARSQAAKTHLERNLGDLPDASLDQMITIALRALTGSVQDGDLNAKNCAVAVVGADLPFTIMEQGALQPYLDQLNADGDDDGGAGGEAGGAGEAEGAVTDAQGDAEMS